MRGAVMTPTGAREQRCSQRSSGPQPNGSTAFAPLIRWTGFRPKLPRQSGRNAVNPFISQHAPAVIGTLSGFDRLVFRGTLRFLSHTAGMKSYLWTMKVLPKDFATHAQDLAQRLRAATEALARRTGRPVRYLASSSTNKEGRADLHPDGGRAVSVIRDRARPRGQGTAYRTAPSQVPVPLPLSMASKVRVHACPHPDMVPVRHPDLPQRSAVLNAVESRYRLIRGRYRRAELDLGSCSDRVRSAT